MLAPIFACLYPVTTAATLGAAYAVAGFFDMLGMGSRSVVAVGATLAAAVAVCWTVGRRDQLWGLHRAHYRARHVARLVIFALVANAAALNDSMPQRTGGVGEFFGAMFTHRLNLMAMLAMVAFWQWILTRGYLTRLYWNTKLVMWHFRPRDFPVADFLPQSRSARPAPRPPLDLPPPLQKLEDEVARRRRAR